ncbi:hypothetical protein B5722_10010 [Escherichia coli]|uniref:Asparagine synthetase n=1 Tax=Escherichia coli TaxID=562 RepID=A0A346GGG5_ECOLX|nr:hypothetical protein CWB37_05385 [Escherichia coli]AUA45767.1 hypothetical protein CWO47_11865 [Escherichia coli]AXO06361.1 hypothetical protein DS732_08300 [Escherichia coli]MBT8502551.1 hypothetical protein [Escherichia coli]NAT93084.1 hypothetical protein [Escherichia coli]
MNKSHFVSNLAPVKYKHSIKPAKNYRFINKYILTPDLFSPIDNHHYVFYFFTAKSLAHSAALRHFFKQANTTSNKYKVNGEGYVFNFWRIRYQKRRS